MFLQVASLLKATITSLVYAGVFSSSQCFVALRYTFKNHAMMPPSTKVGLNLQPSVHCKARPVPYALGHQSFDEI